MAKTEPAELRLRDVAGSLEGLWRRIGLAVIARLVGGAFALVVPFALGKLVGMIAGDAPDGVAVWTAVLAGAIVLHLLGEFVAATASATARHRLIARMRGRWFGRLVRSPIGAFDEARLQDWVTLLGRDIGRIAGFVVSLPTSVAYTAILGVGSIALMATLSVPLAGVVALVGPFVFLAGRLLARRVRSMTATYWNAEVEALRHAHETLEAISVVKTFAVEDERVAAQGSRDDEAARLGAAQQRLMNLVGPATQFVALIGVLTIVWVSTRGWIALGTAELTAFVGYALLLTSPLRSAASLYSAAMEASGALERFKRASRFAPEITGGEVLELDELDLAFEDVSFGYDGTPVFERPVSLRIRGGDSVVVVGENGEGKSTLLALLLRLREPTSGRVTLNGVDVGTLNLRWYRRLFAVALQETVVVDGSIRENVRFGRPGAGDDAIELAARASLLDEVVESLPDGWETRVGEHGVKLSGGQRQRLAIARAFLCDAPIVVFDEATSMFDPSAQRRFVRRNNELFARKTLIWVTHGDAAREVADRVVEVHGGALRAPLRSVEEQRA